MSNFKKGYNKNNKKNKKFRFISSLIIDPFKKKSLYERVIKFLIFISLRIVIWPSKWKNKKKNSIIIDDAYKSLVSNDSYFIPSAITYYLLVAFIPTIGLSLYFLNLDFVKKIMYYLNSTFDSESFKKRITDPFPGIITLIPDFNFSNSNDIYTFIFILFGALYISSTGFASIVYGQAHIYDAKKIPNWFTAKFKGFLTSLVFIFLFCNFGLINITINDWFNSKLKTLNLLKELFLWILFLIEFFVIMTTIFKITSYKRMQLSSLLPGISISTIPTFIMFIFLIVPITFLAKDNLEKYGIFGTIIFLGFITYYISLFIFLGITTNATFYRAFLNKENF